MTAVGDMNYQLRRRDNERVASAVNAAWGAQVATVEDVWFEVPKQGHLRAFRGLLPVVVSTLVNGRMRGNPRVPAFFGGPAPETLFK